MTRRVLVTGGAGFIGSHLVDRLLDAGYAVRVLDDFSTGKRENLAGRLSRIELIEGDVRERGLVARAVDGCWGVAHLAAIASVSRSFEAPEETVAVNTGGTQAVLAAAALAGARRVVFSSTCAVYGDAAEPPIAEEAPTAPLSPYAASKLAAERLLLEAAEDGRLQPAVLRFFNVYGPRQDAASDYAGVIAAFMERAVAGEPVTVYGDGEQTRDFVFVGDVTRACRMALEREEAGAGPINIGAGAETSVNAIAEEVARAAGRALEVRREAAREGDVRRSRAAVARAREALGWRAEVPFAEGLRRTWTWYAGPRE